MGRPSPSSKKSGKSERPPRPPSPSQPTLLARDFTEDEILEFRDAFGMFDRDGSGRYDGARYIFQSND